MHGELVVKFTEIKRDVKEYTKKVKQFARMSDELYMKTFGDRKNE